MESDDVNKTNLERFTDVIIGNRIASLVLCVCVIVILGLQLKNLEVNSTTYVLNNSHPVRVADNQLSEIFTSTGAILSVLIAPKSDTVFDGALLASIREMTQDFEDMNLVSSDDISKLKSFAVDSVANSLITEVIQEGLQARDRSNVKKLQAHLKSISKLSEKDKAFFQDLLIFMSPIARVRSITNIENVWEEEEELIIDKFVNEIPKDASALNDLANKIDDNPLVLESVVSKDHRATIIRVELTVPNDYTVAVIRAYEYILEKVAKTTDQEFDIAIGGSAVVFNEMSHIIKQDNRRFFPFVLIVIMLTLALCFRTVAGIYIPILVSVASLVCTMGIMPLVGLKQNMISTMTPIFVMASAVADSIHFLNHYYRKLAENSASREQAILQTIKKLFKPLFLTSITTICGFLSLAFTEVIFIREFGILVAIGIFFAFVFTLTMVPALLMLGKNKNSNKSRNTHQTILLSGIKAVIACIDSIWQKHAKITFGLMLVAFSVSISYAINVVVDYETVSFYPEESRLRLDDSTIKKHFDGIIPLTIRMDGANDGDLYRQAAIKYIDEVEALLKDNPNIGFVVSPNSYLKRMEQVLNNGKRDQLSADMTDMLAAQLFLLYDNSNGQEIRDVVDINYRHGRIVAFVSTDRASVVRQIVEEVKKIPVPNTLATSIASHASIVLAATDEIIYGQLNSIIITSFVVFVIMAFLFRNLILGLVAITPLVLTLLINFGIMGWLKLDLNIATVIIAALVFGIGIDYSIHFIEAASRHYRTSRDKLAAIAMALKNTAEPILINSLTLAAGFLVLTISQLKPLIYLGNLISATMIISAVLTLVLLPVLLALLPVNLVTKAQSSDDTSIMIDTKKVP